MALREKEMREVLKDYLDGKCNTYYVLDKLGYGESTELYELLYLFKREGSDNVETLMSIVQNFINKD